MLTPVMITWIASFGGSLHAPITQYFYLGVGADEINLGALNTVSIVGALITSPIIGWLVDNGFTIGGIFFCACCCAIGCFIRAMANSVQVLFIAVFILGFGSNLWNIVLAYISIESDPEYRTIVISGFLGQQTIIRLVGKCLYPLVDYLLRDVIHIESKMARYRYNLSFCSLFCMYGVLKLGRRLTFSGHRPLEVPERKTVVLEKSIFPYCEMTGIAFIIMTQESFRTCIAIFWPLYLQRQYNWESFEYSQALISVSIAGLIGLSIHPRLERITGQVHASGFVLLATSITGSISFQFPGQPLYNVVGVTLLSVCLGASESCLLCLATSQLPKSVQGKLFSALNIIKAFGGILGGSVGAVMFQMDPSFPFLFHSIAAFLSLLLLTGLQWYYYLKEPQTEEVPVGEKKALGRRHSIAVNYI